MAYAVRYNICETVNMRNITVSVDEETHRLARIRAAELDTSVSALVREYLRELRKKPMTEIPTADDQGSHEDYLRGLDNLFTDWDAHGVGLRGYDRLTREEVHDRQRARLEMRMAIAEERNEDLESELARLTTSFEEVNHEGKVAAPKEKAEG